jgi:hypothetical protein
MTLPTCAIHREQGTGEATPVVIIQAQVAKDNEVVVGFRFIHGGNGVATLKEMELLDEPTEVFMASSTR